MNHPAWLFRAPHQRSQDIMDVRVPVSFGELIDKITILEIKIERIADAEKRGNVGRELEALAAVLAGCGPLAAAVDTLRRELKAVNEALWDIEDRIRDHERARTFDAGFIELARAVYITNDRRAALKRALNTAVGSALVEEKSYAAY